MNEAVSRNREEAHRKMEQHRKAMKAGKPEESPYTPKKRPEHEISVKGGSRSDEESHERDWHNYLSRKVDVKEKKLVDKILDDLLSEGLKQARKNVGMDPDKPSCWKGYSAKGTKMKGGKEVPDCVKEECEKCGCEKCKCKKPHGGDGGKAGPNKNYVKPMGDLEEATALPSKIGNTVSAVLLWRGKAYSLQMFFPSPKVPNRKEIQDELRKVYPGCNLTYYQIKQLEPGQPLLYVPEGASWTKKEGQNKEGGLNEKGRKSYEAENPGSDLKAPSKEVGNPRRASFCARMSGMKKKLTSSKTANDPDSRINKSLRAWNC